MALRLDRGVGAMRKLGAEMVDEAIRNGHPEYLWTVERHRSAAIFSGSSSKSR